MTVYVRIWGVKDENRPKEFLMGFEAYSFACDAGYCCFACREEPEIPADAKVDRITEADFWEDFYQGKDLGFYDDGWFYVYVMYDNGHVKEMSL